MARDGSLPREEPGSHAQLHRDPRCKTHRPTWRNKIININWSPYICGSYMRCSSSPADGRQIFYEDIISFTDRRPWNMKRVNASAFPGTHRRAETLTSCKKASRLHHNREEFYVALPTNWHTCAKKAKYWMRFAALSCKTWQWIIRLDLSTKASCMA